ncbi:MAG TPA: hypothetical protein VJV78_29985 [Polyangiales bacterium]|nr:hypothetical protein [Polyangiales bacterium]
MSRGTLNIMPPAAWSGVTALCLALSCVSQSASGQASWPAGPWPLSRSGINGDPRIDRTSVEAFGDWRGRPVDIAVVYTDRTSWESMTRGSGWLFDNFKGFVGELVVSQGMVPNGRAQDMAGCAAGQFDQYFRDFGTLIVRYARPTTIVRIGWEFNGDYMPWAATNTRQWIDCFRHAAQAIRSTAPRVQIDWTINSHGTPSKLCGGVSTNCYPGDDVVDIIGIDNYDLAPSSTSQADFDRVANEPDGLNWLLAFAKSRGKKMSIGEWGVAPRSDYNTTGQNPHFIYWMHRWFKQHAADIAYESYFNSCDAGVGSNLFRSVNANCPLNSAAGNMYKMLFRDPELLPWPDPRAL